MDFSALLGQSPRREMLEGSPESGRIKRRKLSTKHRRLWLEKLFAREMLAADVGNPDELAIALSAEVGVQAGEALQILKTKEARLEAERLAATPVSVDSWLLSWDESQPARIPFGPNFIRSVEPTELIKDAYLVQFHQTFTQSEALAELGLTATPELAYPLVASQLTPNLIPGDANFQLQYHLRNAGQFVGTVGEDIRVETVWDTRQGAGVVIGIVDDGVDYSHPDLDGNYRPALSYDYNENDNNPFPNVQANIHGTAVAGVAVAELNGNAPNSGVVGVAPQAGFAAIRLTAQPATDSQVANALRHQPNSIHIYNNSWGPADTGSIVSTGQAGPLARAALAAGATTGRGGLGSIYVFSAGNGGGGDNVNFNLFANSRHTIAVGAVTNTGAAAAYSEAGAPLLVSGISTTNLVATTGVGAPVIFTTDINGPYGYNTTGWTNADDRSQFGGTSAAAAQVSGVVALMLQANPNLTSRDVQHILVTTARRNATADPSWRQNGTGRWVSDRFGYGVVNAQAAVAAAASWTNVSPELSWESAVLTPRISIPDNNATGVTVNFGVPDNFRVEHAELLLDTVHTWGGDLVTTLISPTSPANMNSPMTTLSNGIPTYTFNHPLTTARHWGEGTFGNWTLNVRDGFAGDVGSLERARLRIYGNVVDTALPNLTATAVTATEGAGVTMNFVIQLSEASATDVTFSARTFDGTAVAGSDYVALDDVPFTIPAGQLSVTIPVSLINDSVEEIAKTFSLGLTNFVGSDPLVRAPVGTINDDDDPPFYTAGPRVTVGAPELMTGVSNNNPILLNSPTDIDDLQFPTAAGTLVTARVDPESDTVILRGQFVDATGAVVGPVITASGPGVTLVMPPTLLNADGTSAVRVWSQNLESTRISVDLLFNGMTESWGSDTTQTSAQGITASYLPLGSGKFTVLGEFTSSTGVQVQKVNNPAAFVDISTTGTALNLGDDVTVTLNTTRGNVMLPAGPIRVSNNGMIGAGTSGTPSFSNGLIPNTTFPSNTFLAPYWDDFFSSTGNVYWQERDIDGIPAVIVQWHDRVHWDNQSGSTATVQAQIFSSGPTLVRYVYPDVDFGSAGLNFGASATIGYQITQQNFLQYSRNEAVIANGDAITFFTQEDFDRYTIDLTGMAGKKIDLALVPIDGANLSGATMRLLGTNGTTVLATAVSNPSGILTTNYAKGIHGFVVPANGVYTIELASGIPGKYAVVVTDSLAYDSEPNNLSTGTLRTIDQPVSGYGYLGVAGSPVVDTIDHYQTSLAVDDYIIVRTSTPQGTGGLSVSSTLDPAVQMFSPSGASLWSEDNTATDGKNVFKYFRALEAGTFRLAVSAAAGRGTYVLNIDPWVNRNPDDIALTPSSIAENAGAAATIGTLTTSDVDPGDTHVYSLVAGTGDTDNAAFTIDGATLKANSSFNFEAKNSYSIRVRSTDQRSGTFEKVFTVSVTDVNETPTDIALAPASLPENAGVNAVVGTLSTTDVDAGDTFTYTLVAGAGSADNAAFNISGAQLRASASFNFEAKSSYTVRVRSTDAGGLFFEKAFTVTVTDVNETPTNIVLTPSALPENAGANAVVGTLSTTDVDAGDTFTYTLVAGSGDADNGAFNINGAELRANASFNFESKSSYTVRVRSTDAGGLFFEKSFTIDVTDVNETPTDIALTPSSLPENAGVNAVVGTLSTTDVDAGDTFTYTLVAGDGDADNGAFNIDGAQLRANASFDFEADSSYTVRVRSTDAGGLFVEKSFTVTVTDVNETPTDIALAPTSINENSGANAVVGTLSTTDQDGGDSFTYTLVAGSGDTDNGSFHISGAQVRADSNLNFENKSSYTVRVRSTDAGGLFFEKSFTITVNNMNDAPTDIAVSSTTIAENLPVNTVVGTLSTTDEDAGDTFTYTLVAGTGDIDNASFNISGNSLRASSTFNFESDSSYSIRVRSTDAAGAFFEKSFVITVLDVNEAPTNIALSSTSIAENAGANAVVGTLSTTDVDAGETFTYTLVSGDGDADNGAFSIDGDQLQANASFDFEVDSSYTVRVRSTDAGGLFFEKSFTITVTNVNEAPTNIGLSASTILERAVAYTTAVTIGTLTATDPDAGDSHDFELVAGVNDNSFFSISDDVLSLVAGTTVDFETKPSYTIKVRATDAGGLTYDKEFVITVVNRGEIQTVVIGDGTAQRSIVKGLTVTFDSEVTIGAGAFEVVKRGTSGGPVDVAFTTQLDGQGRTVASLTFSGTRTRAGSLVDGNYELRVNGNLITDATGALDLDRNGSNGGTYFLGTQATDKFFRHFGDVNGDRGVGLGELNGFRAAFGSNSSSANWNPRYDENGSNSIDLNDLNQFKSRFGRTLNFE